LSFIQSHWAFCVISNNYVFINNFRVLIEEELIVVTIIVTHQGVEKLIDSDAPPNPKDVGLFEAK